MFRLTLRLALLLSVFAGAATARAQTAVYAALTTSIDSGSVKTDTSINAKLRQSVKLPDGSKLPAGAILVGHITSVKDGENSSISFVFDKITFDDTTLNVKVEIRRLDDPPINADDTDEDSHDIKKDGKLVSKIRNVTLEPSAGDDSATVSTKGKSVRLESNTLLGCLISVKA